MKRELSLHCKILLCFNIILLYTLTFLLQNLHSMRVLAVGDHFFIISKLNKTSCFKFRHFINIYIINRTFHGRLGIRILSSRAESKCFQVRLEFSVLRTVGLFYS